MAGLHGRIPICCFLLSNVARTRWAWALWNATSSSRSRSFRSLTVPMSIAYGWAAWADSDLLFLTLERGSNALGMGALERDKFIQKQELPLFDGSHEYCLWLGCMGGYRSAVSYSRTWLERAGHGRSGTRQVHPEAGASAL